MRQVLIESRIVIVNDDFSHELGVRFGLTRVQANGQRRPRSSRLGSAVATDTGLESALDNLADGSTAAPVPIDMIRRRRCARTATT